MGSGKKGFGSLTPLHADGARRRSAGQACCLLDLLIGACWVGLVAWAALSKWVQLASRHRPSLWVLPAQSSGSTIGLAKFCPRK